MGLGLGLTVVAKPDVSCHWMNEEVVCAAEVDAEVVVEECRDFAYPRIYGPDTRA